MISTAIPWLAILAILGVLVTAFPLVTVLATGSALGLASTVKATQKEG